MTKRNSKKRNGKHAETSRAHWDRLVAIRALREREADEKKAREAAVVMTPDTEISVNPTPEALDPLGKDFSMFRPENRFRGLDYSSIEKLIEKPSAPDVDTGIPVLDRYIVSLVTGDPLTEKDKRHLMDPYISSNPTLREGRIKLFHDTGLSPITLADAHEIGISFLRSKER